MSDSPEQIRADIEQTRQILSENVNALADSTSPAHIAQRQVNKVKDSARDLKTRVFGDPDDPTDGVVGEAAGRASAVAGGAVDAVQQAPVQVRRSTQGNPLAAGLIALGLGALVGGLLPSSQLERNLVRTAKDKAQPVLNEVVSMASEAADNLRPVAEAAVTGVRDAAQNAAQSVMDESGTAKETVIEQARVSADQVRQDAPHLS